MNPLCPGRAKLQHGRIPCKGHYDDDGWLVDKNDSCVNEAREYSTHQYELTNASIVHAFVDLRVGRVAELGGPGALPYEIREFKKGSATPGSPQQDAKVREILFGNGAVNDMVAGRKRAGASGSAPIVYVYAPGEPLTSEDKTIAMVDVYFDPVLRWSGSLPTQLERCQREHEQALSNGQTDLPAPSDPCWKAPLKYESRPRSFENAPGIYVDIDLRSGQVLQIGGLAPKPGDLENVKEKYGR